MLSAEVEAQSSGTFKLSDPTPVRMLRIVPTVLQPQLPDQFFEVAMKNEDGERWEPHRLESHPRKYSNGLKVTLQCIDADGQHYILSNEDDAYRDVPQPGPPTWQRLWTNRREIVTDLRGLLTPSQSACIALLAALAIAATLLMIVVANVLYGRA